MNINTFSGDFCANINTFSGDFYANVNTFSGDFFIWDFLGEEMFCFCGGFLGDFITLWVVFFLRNLIYYDEYETCGFDFCADGGGAAVGGSKWWFHFGKV